MNGEIAKDIRVFLVNNGHLFAFKGHRGKFRRVKKIGALQMTVALHIGGVDASHLDRSLHGGGFRMRGIDLDGSGDFPETTGHFSRQMTDTLHNFLQFFVSYGMSMGKTQQDADVQLLNKQLESLLNNEDNTEET